MYYNDYNSGLPSLNNLPSTPCLCLRLARAGYLFLSKGNNSSNTMRSEIALFLCR